MVFDIFPIYLQQMQKLFYYYQLDYNIKNRINYYQMSGYLP